MKTDQLKILERYFNDEMDDKEKAAFFESLRSEPELVASFKEYKLIIESLKDKEMLDLREKLKEIRNEGRRTRLGGYFLNQNMNWMWLAAALIIIICMTVVASLLISSLNTKPPVMAYDTSWGIPDNKLLEKELKRYSRRYTNFSLLTPEDSSILNYRGEMMVSWIVDSIPKLQFEMINKEGRIIFDTGKPVESPFLMKGNFPEGLYIFRFRDHNTSIFHGVIYLR